MFVGGNGDTLHQRVADIAHIADDTQFFLAREVVADVGVVVAGRVGGCLRFLYQNRNGNRGTGAGTEDFAALFARQFSAGALITTQIEDIDGRKFAFEAFAHAVEPVGIEPCPVGDNAEDTDLIIVKSVRSPAESLDITVVGRIVEGGFRLGDIGMFNSAFERGIRFVQCIVVG